MLRSAGLEVDVFVGRYGDPFEAVDQEKAMLNSLKQK